MIRRFPALGKGAKLFPVFQPPKPFVLTQARWMSAPAPAAHFPTPLAPVPFSDPTVTWTGEPQFTTQRAGGLLQVTLTRPKALNALTLDMCRNFNNLLETINGKESTVRAFLVRGAGGRAFCAGGDVKSVWEELVPKRAGAVGAGAGAGTGGVVQAEVGTGKPGYLHADFFREEYVLNYNLQESAAPQISLWEGFVMGGGVGLSIFGEFRIATEGAVFAMPETAIGLFPDVGGASWLPHLQEGLGAYIGMTGVRLGPADLVYSGIATHYLASDQVEAVMTSLQEATIPSDPMQSRKIVKDLLDMAQMGCPKPDTATSALAQHAEAIARCFGDSVDSVEGVMAMLKREVEVEGVEGGEGGVEGSKTKEWAAKTLKTLSRMSPTSLKLTWRQLRQGKDRDLKGCLRMEYRLMQRCMQGSDFKEGIRALLVDKDNAPQWNPPTLESVSDESVEAYFEPLEDYRHELDVFVRIPPN